MATTAIQAMEPNLSANDKRILNAIFDPETLPSSVAQSKESSIIDISLPAHPNISNEQLDVLEAQQNDLIHRVSSAEAHEDEEILKELDQIVKKWPTYPSAYLNRAMLHRTRIEATLEQGKSIFDAKDEDIEALFTNLSRAIYASLPSESPASPVSSYQARILRTAYSHRAYLYLKAAYSGKQLRGKGRSDLEELASSDFSAAARYGDEVAREMSVRTNPYAKMCGAIVRNALAEERKSQIES